MKLTRSRQLASENEVELEQLIDRFSVWAVLDAMASICQEKADHIRSSYDDDLTAREWSRTATKVQALANDVEI